MKYRPSILIVLFAALLMAGCAVTGSRKTLSVRDLAAPVLLDRVSQRQNGLTSIEAEGSIAVETPTFANSGSIELHMKEPDSMLVAIEGPFGINVASILLTSRDFKFYNSLQNKLIRGTTSRGSIDTLLHIDIDFTDILGLFVGAVPLNQDTIVPEAYYVEDDRYVLMYRRSGEITQYWVDPETYSVTRIEVKNSAGEPVREVTFSDFRAQGTQWLPYRFRINDYRGRRSVTVKYSKAVLNLRNVKFPFSVPGDAEQVQWQ